MDNNYGISSGVDNYLGYEGMTAEQIARENRKRERSNAKAVECLDMDGKLIEVYRSGMLASQALNIQQGDISLCCRGLKHSVGGYRFRFFGESDLLENITKIKKGFVIETYTEGQGINRSELARSTRASRGDYGQQVKLSAEKQSILVPPELQTRTWNKVKVSVGPFSIMKWVPTSQKNPTPALQEFLPKAGEKKKLKLTKSSKKSSSGSTGFVNRAVVHRDSEYAYEADD